MVDDEWLDELEEGEGAGQSPRAFVLEFLRYLASPRDCLAVLHSMGEPLPPPDGPPDAVRERIAELLCSQRLPVREFLAVFGAEGLRTLAGFAGLPGQDARREQELRALRERLVAWLQRELAGQERSG